jgi:hypothetical protein
MAKENPPALKARFNCWFVCFSLVIVLKPALIRVFSARQFCDNRIPGARLQPNLSRSAVGAKRIGAAELFRQSFVKDFGAAPVFPS